jgi:tRNA(Ile)-lysidine synthase
MNRSLSQRVLTTVGRHSMIRPGDRIGVGVSGGADSVALLHLLAELRAQLGITISVLHFHHQLRGAEADEDERFVKNLAADFRFEFATGRADVAAEARRNAWNLEDAGRRLRHEFFSSVAASRGLSRVAVAHTADDQAETVLAHMLRGTGPAGLAGIYPVAGLVIRPLLEIRREELREYLRGMGCVWREDATNQDTSRMRSRIRHQLLPVLSRDFAPLSVTRLARLAGLAREEEEFWRVLEEERFGTLASRDPAGNISMKIADLFSPLPWLAGPGGAPGRAPDSPQLSTLALTRRLVRRIAAELQGSRNRLTARHVQYVLDLAGALQSGARVELPGIVVRRVFDRLVFSASPNAGRKKTGPKSEAAGGEFEYAIALPGLSKMSSIVVTEIQRRFELKVIDWPSAPGETNSYRGALDFERLRWPLTLRSWRPGDAYRPHGHRRARKLKRLFLESRVSRCARASWPVLTSAGQLVWASGYPVAEEFAPRQGTRKGLVIAEQDLQQAPGEP